MQTIREEGLFPCIDPTYQNGITNKFPIAYLSESELSAKLYAYLRCYGTELREFIFKKFNLPSVPAKLTRMVFLPSEGGEPEVATVYIDITEIRDKEQNLCVSRICPDAQPFSDDLNTKEYMVFRPVKRSEIVEIKPVKETLNQLCRQILKEANPKALEEAAKEKKRTLERAASLGYDVGGFNMFEIMGMIAESPEIDKYLEHVK
jgi:hypothetical protein